MYFDTTQCQNGLSLWVVAAKEPWLGQLLLGMQGNTTDDPDPPFSMLKSVWDWEVGSLLSLIVKPALLLAVLAVSLIGLAAKITILMVLLPLWLGIVLLASIKLGLPDYPQTWVSD